MNHLGHLWTASPDRDLIVGSALGDIVKGLVPEHYAKEVWRGIQLHRAIDELVDTHTSTGAIKQHSDLQVHRRFVGIVLDVHLDHVLATHFSRFSTDTVATVVEHSLHCMHRSEFAEQLQRPIAWLSGRGDPRNFTEEQSVLHSIESLNSRLQYRGIRAPNMQEVYESLLLLDNLEQHCLQILEDCKTFADSFRTSVLQS